ncbi:hypothetical protein DSO57_1016720 [Entomophthora muscae]|uniref:Uncharacterized protein n=1 Tax=Entomophthora muscae TaxID=34485 RepID=A0ACC2RW23_9FUNG|nr:hypothetical protein DSO57_1016720 [Entomophthora muscae]
MLFHHIAFLFTLVHTAPIFPSQATTAIISRFPNVNEISPSCLNNQIIHDTVTPETISDPDFAIPSPKHSPKLRRQPISFNYSLRLGRQLRQRRLRRWSRSFPVRRSHMLRPTYRLRCFKLSKIVNPFYI